jgi:hypothetical protein
MLLMLIIGNNMIIFKLIPEETESKREIQSIITFNCQQNISSFVAKWLRVRISVFGPVDVTVLQE